MLDELEELKERNSLLESVLAETAKYCAEPRPRIMPLEVLAILGKAIPTTMMTTSTK